MLDIFYEETSINNHYEKDKKFYTAFKVSSLASYFLAIILVLFFGANLTGYYHSNNIVLDIISVALPIILLIITGYVLGQIKNRYCNDFDYTVVGSNVRISRVSNNVRRRHILNFDCSQIEQIGLYSSDSFNDILNKNAKLVFLTSNGVSNDQNKKLYYLLVSHEGIRKLLVLECSDELISNIFKSCNRFVLAKELK